MMEFKIEICRSSIPLPENLSARFPAPVIFYMSERGDKRHMFYTFVIVNFPAGEIIYVVSSLPENDAVYSSCPDLHRFLQNDLTNPHSSVSIDRWQKFYTFIQDGNYFFEVDIPARRMRVRHGGEILPLTPGEEIVEITSTVFLDKTDPGHIYLAAMVRRDGSGKHAIDYYRLSLDLKHVEKLYRVEYATINLIPHQTMKYRDMLLNSAFTRMCFRDRHGEYIENKMSLRRYLFRELYKDYCRSRGVEYSYENFLKGNKVFEDVPVLEPGFSEFCSARGKDLADIILHNPGYMPAALPGEVSVFDFVEGKERMTETSCCAPAHFELDEKADVLYASSHNFVRLPQIYFLGPAVIDKVVVRGKQLERVATFSTPTGYRFTSHRLFYREGRPYLCTIGHPNRMMIADAETMKLVSWVDIGKNRLGGYDDLGICMNTNDFRDCRLGAMEVSSDGEYIFVPGHGELHVVRVMDTSVVASAPFIPAPRDVGGMDLGRFVLSTAHTSYLS